MTTRRMMQRLILFICGTFTMLAPSFAQKVGTTSMQFLRVMPVARGTAMGDAFAALATGAEALFWNPGGVVDARGVELTTTYIDWIFDTQQGALGAAMHIENFGAVGVQLQFVDYGVFDEAIADPALLTQSPHPGLTGRQFHPYTYLVGATYARSFTDKFSAGLSLKYAKESLFDRSVVNILNDDATAESVNTFANGLLFDFGMLYKTGFRTIRIAGAIQNFGGSLTYAKESSPAPLLFRLGFAVDLFGPDAALGNDDDGRTTLTFEMFQPNDYSQQIHAGMEYEFLGMIAVRVGYKFNYDVEGITIGGGVRQSIGDTPLKLDYSYGSMGEFLGMTHRFSLGASF